MAERFEKLDRMRADIQRDRDKVAELLERIKVKEAKLKEAEASQIVAEVGALNMTPEQLAEFLELVKAGKISTFMNTGATNGISSGTNSYSSVKDEVEDTEDDMEDIEDEDN